MQAFGKDFVDGGVAQARVQFGGQALGRPAIVPRQAGEDVVQLFHAGAQRARHVGAQQQQFGDLAGIGGAPVHLGIGFEGRQRSEQGAPLVVATGGTVADRL
ncbi:hypothetical protein D3C76_1524840 [compost metagenome]